MKIDFEKFVKENWMLILAIGYLLFPFDIIPDFLPMIGYSEDIGALVLALIVKIYQHHKENAKKDKEKKDNVIEGEIVEK